MKKDSETETNLTITVILPCALRSAGSAGLETSLGALKGKEGQRRRRTREEGVRDIFGKQGNIQAGHDDRHDMIRRGEPEARRDRKRAGKRRGDDPKNAETSFPAMMVTGAGEFTTQEHSERRRTSSNHPWLFSHPSPGEENPRGIAGHCIHLAGGLKTGGRRAGAPHRLPREMHTCEIPGGPKKPYRALYQFPHRSILPITRGGSQLGSSDTFVPRKNTCG